MDPIRDDTAYQMLRIVRDAGVEGCAVRDFVAAMWPDGSRNNRHAKPINMRRGAGSMLAELARRGLCMKFGLRAHAVWRLTPTGEKWLEARIAHMNAALAAKSRGRSLEEEDWSR